MKSTLHNPDQWLSREGDKQASWQISHKANTLTMNVERLPNERKLAICRKYFMGKCSAYSLAKTIHFARYKKEFSDSWSCENFLFFSFLPAFVVSFEYILFTSRVFLLGNLDRMQYEVVVLLCNNTCMKLENDTNQESCHT